MWSSSVYADSETLNPFLDAAQDLRKAYGIFFKLCWKECSCLAVLLSPGGRVLASALSDPDAKGKHISSAIRGALQELAEHPDRDDLLFECLVERAHIQ